MTALLAGIFTFVVIVALLLALCGLLSWFDGPPDDHAPSGGSATRREGE